MNPKLGIEGVHERQSGWRAVNQTNLVQTPAHLGLHTGTSHLVLAATGMGVAPGKQAECQLFQRGRCHYGEQCKYLHVVKTGSVRNVETAKGFSRGTDVASHSRNGHTKHSTPSSSEGLKGDRPNGTDTGNSYPVRSGAEDCQYYLKTGKCNYGSRCKFNHPFRDENLVNALNRRDCFDFVQKGTCPYGKTCKYNHPVSGEGITALEPQTDSSSGSPASSPRSISRLPKRSTSELHYSGTRELTEDYAFVPDKLPLQVRGRTVHALPSWEVATTPVTHHAEKGIGGQEQHRMGSAARLAVQQKTVPTPIANAWCQTSGDQVAPVPPLPRGNVKVSTVTAEPFPAISTAFNSSDLSLSSGLAQRDTSMTSSHHSSNLYSQSQRQHGSYEGEPSAWLALGGIAASPTEAISSVTASTAIRNTSEIVDGQRGGSLGTSIWANNFAGELSKEHRVPVPALFEYHIKPSYPNGTLPHETAMSSVDMSRDGSKVLNSIWGSARSPNIYAPNLNPAVSSATQRVDPMASDPALDYVQTSLEPANGLHNLTAWRSGYELGGMSRISEEAQRFRQQQQYHEQYPHVTERHVTERQARYHGLGLQSEMVKSTHSQNFVPNGSLEVQSFSKKEGEQINTQFGMLHGTHSVATSSRQGHERTRSVEWVETDVAKRQQRASLLDTLGTASMDSHNFADMWRPAEKSPTFGPGLFGMQHRLF